METLVVVAQHKNQYYGKAKHHGPVSSPSRGFKGINCRSFQSGAGLLPTPLKSCCTPATKQGSSASPKTPSSIASSSSPDTSNLIISPKSAPIPINFKASNKGRCLGGEICEETFACSELWAGPAYSNSPPPSSLPIPKFSMRPKRTVSLELPKLPISDHDIRIHPIAKSAPASPTAREHSPFTRELFHSADSATKTLRRILNLDIADE